MDMSAFLLKRMVSALLAGLVNLANTIPAIHALESQGNFNLLYFIKWRAQTFYSIYNEEHCHSLRDLFDIGIHDSGLPKYTRGITFAVELVNLRYYQRVLKDCHLNNHPHNTLHGDDDQRQAAVLSGHPRAVPETIQKIKKNFFTI